jgi:hypothetical protein
VALDKRQRALFNLSPHQLRQLGDVRGNRPRLIAQSGLIWIKPHSFNVCSSFSMLSFTYRCPRTGQIVHGHVADDLISGGETYEPLTCTACGGIHLINHKTGKLLEQAVKP